MVYALLVSSILSCSYSVFGPHTASKQMKFTMECICDTTTNTIQGWLTALSWHVTPVHALNVIQTTNTDPPCFDISIQLAKLSPGLSFPLTPQLISTASELLRHQSCPKANSSFAYLFPYAYWPSLTQPPQIIAACIVTLSP